MQHFFLKIAGKRSEVRWSSQVQQKMKFWSSVKFEVQVHWNPYLQPRYRSPFSAEEVADDYDACQPGTDGVTSWTGRKGVSSWTFMRSDVKAKTLWWGSVLDIWTLWMWKGSNIPRPCHKMPSTREYWGWSCRGLWGHLYTKHQCQIFNSHFLTIFDLTCSLLFAISTRSSPSKWNPAQFWGRKILSTV